MTTNTKAATAIIKIGIIWYKKGNKGVTKSCPWTLIIVALYSLKKSNLVIYDDSAEAITKRLIVFFRGFFYEWALSNSNFNLVKETEKEMKLYLSLFIKIDD